MTRYDFSPLIQLYKRMDAAFDRAAARYSFQCNGCTDNCCTSLFFHHTFIEKAFLVQAFLQMDDIQRKAIQNRATEYVDQTFPQGSAGRSLKVMCPLNHQGRCSLYAFRPMICRLHGLPHELHPPGRQSVRGPGCETGRFDGKPYVSFDRTPFYVDMAALEQRFKAHHNLAGRPRQTVAQMLLTPEA